MGVTRQYYNLIENGERQRKMDLTLIQKLAVALNTTTDYIIQQEMKTA